MIRRIILTMIVSATASVASGATTTMTSALAQESVLSRGRVVKVNANAATITIEHTPIAHLYMEPMTMIFRVKDPTMLIGLMPGDKIRFKVERTGGSYVVTEIENSN